MKKYNNGFAKKAWTAQEFAAILQERKDKKKIVVIAREHQRTANSIYNIIQQHKYYKAGKPISKYYEKLFQSFDQAINLKQNGFVTPPPTTLAVTPDTRFTRLKKAQEVFEQELSLFIEAEVAAQVSVIVKENEQLQKTIRRLNEENNAMQAAFLDAKNSNWVDALRKRFQQ